MPGSQVQVLQKQEVNLILSRGAWSKYLLRRQTHGLGFATANKQQQRPDPTCPPTYFSLTLHPEGNDSIQGGCLLNYSFRIHFYKRDIEWGPLVHLYHQAPTSSGNKGQGPRGDLVFLLAMYGTCRIACFFQDKSGTIFNTAGRKKTELVNSISKYNWKSSEKKMLLKMFASVPLSKIFVQ